MILLDSNVFIYLSKGTIDGSSIAGGVIAHASISEIEVLGYQKITARELVLLRRLFAQSATMPLSQDVVDTAIELRQVKTMSLRDSIVAATAISAGVKLWTANVKDFSHIDGLDLHNPVP